MKKGLMIFAAALLVTGVAFADGSKKKTKTSCNKHEGKTCSKQAMKKDDKATAPATKN
jgi:hypothetical protein